jgi:hypothetical protein
MLGGDSIGHCGKRPMRWVRALYNIQSNSGRKVNIFGDDIIGLVRKRLIRRVRAMCHIQGDLGENVNLL